MSLTRKLLVLSLAAIALPSIQASVRDPRVWKSEPYAPGVGPVGDPQVWTDHPYYPGEGALSTPQRIVDTALAIPRGGIVEDGTDRSKFIKLFLWRSEHFTHGPAPMIYNLPGYQPDPAGTPLGRDNGGMPQMDMDAMRALFSYGWGECGVNHAQMGVFFASLGWPHRCRPLYHDVTGETFVDGKWCQFNADQYSLHFLEDNPHAPFASVDENIAALHRHLEWNPDLGLWDPAIGSYRLPQINTKGHYEDFTSPYTGRIVPHRSVQWRDWYAHVWDVPVPRSRYADAYTAAPIAYRLRRGETFTRWLHPDGAPRDLGLAARIWWGWNSETPVNTGPFFRYSFIQNAPARDEIPGEPEDSLGMSAYGNGCYDWSPDLSTDDYLDGVADRPGAVVHSDNPRLKATTTSTLTLHHSSPYTIAGRPLDRYDPANEARDGAVLEAEVVGTVPVRISVNGGITWSSLRTLSATLTRVDFTNQVKGRNQYLLRFAFNANEGLNHLRLRTVTMASQSVYPNLKASGSTVRYRAGHVGVIELSPDLWTAQTAASTSGFIKKVAESPNISYLHYSGTSIAMRATDNNPISVTYKVTMPRALARGGAVYKQIHAALAAGATLSSLPRSYSRIEYATKAAGPWTELAAYTIPTDNDVSSYWVYGRTPDETSLGKATVFLRFTTHDPGWKAKILYFRVYGTYVIPTSPPPLEVTFSWSEDGNTMAHTHVVPAGASVDVWTIDTGSNIVQDKVVFRVPGS